MLPAATRQTTLSREITAASMPCASKGKNSLSLWERAGVRGAYEIKRFAKMRAPHPCFARPLPEGEAFVAACLAGACRRLRGSKSQRGQRHQHTRGHQRRHAHRAESVGATKRVAETASRRRAERSPTKHGRFT